MLTRLTFSTLRHRSWATLTLTRNASNRNYYVRDGSNPQNISEEVRDLIRNARTQENIADWKLGPGIQEPLVLDMKDPMDIDDDQVRLKSVFVHSLKNK